MLSLQLAQTISMDSYIDQPPSNNVLINGSKLPVIGELWLYTQFQGQLFYLPFKIIHDSLPHQVIGRDGLNRLCPGFISEITTSNDFPFLNLKVPYNFGKQDDSYNQ